MELIEAASLLAALSQPNRLAVFRLLVAAPAGGLCAGEISKRLELPKPTLSFHLKELSRAGIIQGRRNGRSLFYAIRPDRVREIMGFLTEDCCQGRPELCLPSSESLCCATR